MARFNLPDISFAEKSASDIENDILNNYERLTNKRLTNADPRLKFIQSIVPIFVQQRSLIDFSAKSNLLSYTFGDYADHLGTLLDVTRLEAQAATTKFRIHLSAIREETVTIPAGTQITNENGDIIFFTSDVAEIKPGEIYADVSGECQELGVVGNGFEPGMLNVLVTPIPFVERVENIKESAGGFNKEDDESYVERIRSAPEKFSTAGPANAYKYWARTASPLIEDILVYSPGLCIVEIVPLLKNGQLPTAELLDKIENICNDEDIRPLTDLVNVVPPNVVNYNLDVTYYLDPVTDIESTQNAIDEAINEFTLWQKSKLGRNINPSELIRKIMNAGAKRVEVFYPQFTNIAKNEVAIEDEVNVNFGGIEND